MFPGRLLNFRSSTSIELVRPQPAQSQQANQQQQHLAVTSSPTIEPISPELTYTYTPTGVPPYILELKIGVPVMVIRNVLHPHLVNGAMFFLKSFKRNVPCISTVPTDNTPPQTFLLHRIDFQFDFRDFKFTRRQFPIRWPLALPCTRNKDRYFSDCCWTCAARFFSWPTLCCSGKNKKELACAAATQTH